MDAMTDGTARRQRMVLLLLLSATYAVNYVDRQILAILLEPIKRDFDLSDSMLGLLAGPAFALFYATMGVPIAVLADRRSRTHIIGFALICFSAATAACGLVTQFWQLVAARVMTGVGEAGTGPASQSIITDLFPPETRGRAQATYAVGVNIGIMVAFLVGGWLAHRYGWRVAFIAVGLPGLLLSPFFFTRGREPARRDPGAAAAAPSMMACLRFLRGQRAYCWLVVGSGLSAFAGYGVATFVPAFLMRSHGLDTQQVGAIFAIILGIGGGLCTFGSGVMVDWLGKRDVRWYMRVPIIGILLALPFWPLFLLAPNIVVAILAAIVPLSVSAVYIGPVITTIQMLAPPRMRARAAAIQLFIGNLIGLGLGPQVIGIVSDALAPVYGNDSLRYALLAGVAASFCAMFAYWRASRTLAANVARVAPA
ncbi:spinster family MFS transporter [Sphingomonas sp. MS122]|uniref:spinster family MFS transporter n=1 Tax=Sphingomonas sp. MS122 TaxID=3412683 RepID=UPI003C301361